MSHDERDDYDDEPWRKRRTPEQLVRPVAIALRGCGWLFGVLALGWVAMFVIFLIDPQTGPDADQTTNLLIAGGFTGACALWSVGLFRGARRMGGFQGYWAALLAAALAVLPVAFPHAALITIPIGVWALVVLLRRDVRARFAENRRTTLPESL
jgi:hypothetical protein